MELKCFGESCWVFPFIEQSFGKLQDRARFLTAFSSGICRFS
ncbi:hypothetical protein T190_16950 [Sinorhizobium meliloti CCBAU 01290]|nr:hypothetical protein T190_16950 [Sinorhizobium meliloti CCBAU 01290]